MAERIRAHDWASTPLGSVETWSDRLKLMVEQVLANPLVASLVCGSGHVLIYNDAAARLYGGRHPAALGRALPETFPEGWATVAPYYARAAAGETVHVVGQSLDTRGEGFPTDIFDAVLVPVRGADGQVSCVHMTGSEVGERLHIEAALRASEERQALLLRLSDAIRTNSDPGDIQRIAMRLLGEHLDLSRAYYFDVVREDAGWVHVIESAYQREPGGPTMIGRHSLKNFGDAMFEGFARGEVIAVADVGTLTDITPEERASYRALGVTAFINVPLLRDGTYSAGIGAHDTRPHDWTAAEVDLVREVVARTWAAVERARAEAALRESEERFRTLFETMRQGYVLGEVVRNPSGRAVDLRYIQVNPEGERLVNVSPGSAIGRTAREVFPGIEEAWIETADRVVSERQHVRGEYEVAASGQWLEVYWYPEAGNRYIGLFDDITDRRRTEAALRESEERFRQFADASSDALWIRDATTLTMEYTSPAIQPIYGIAPDDLLGEVGRWLSLIVPDDRGTALRHIEQAKAGESVVHEFRIRRPSDGQERWIRNTDFPLRDERGRVQRIGGLAEDVTEVKRMQERQGVLVAELQHRTRNLMGVVRSMTDKTLARSADLADFGARYGDRLSALARVQGLLSRLDEGDRVTFDELIHSELSAIGGESDRIALEGPDGVALRSSTVQTFSLALHELATNALKYGALAQRDGRLAISWRVEREENDGRPWLVVDWRESGVVMPAPGTSPRGGGSGRELIERALPYQLGAKTRYVMGADGVHCRIALPVSKRQRIREMADG